MTTHYMRPGELEAELQARLAAARAPRPRKTGAAHPRGRIRTKTAVVVAMMALLVGAVSVWADGGTLNVEVADNTGYAVATTDDGAIVEYIGDEHTTFGSSGSGTFDAFLRTHASPSEQGYNTDARNPDYPFPEFDEVGGGFTESILVSDIPVVTCESVDGSVTTSGLCWELFADINDSNSTPLIQLTDLEIYFTSDPEIFFYPFTGEATKVYDFEGVVHINDVNPGSGRGDLRYSVPLTGIDLSTLAPDCEYGSSTCTTYFVVFTGWGDPEGGTYSTDAGFNEWKVKEYPFLDVEKTATETFTRTYNWTIDKSVTPDTWALFDGETGTSRYTISVDKTGFTDSNWAVSGNITITNPSDQDAIVQTVTDSISGVGSVTVVCPVTLPTTLEPDETLICTYSSPLADGATRTNTATATLSDGPAFTDDEQIVFGDPTTEVNDSITVVDNNLALPGEPVPFSDDGSVQVDKTFDCSSLTIADGGSGSYSFNNTATIVETSQTDSEQVDVTCYRLDVEKTVDESLTRTWNWTIDKTVTPATWDLFDGETGTSEYTISVDKVDSTDSGWAIEGVITITNPHPTREAIINSVTDVISGTGLTDVNATVSDCDGDATAPYTVPAADSVECDYSATLDSGVERTNTATATQQLYDFDHLLVATADGTEPYTDAEDVDFSEATITDVNATIHVSDDDLDFEDEPLAFSDDGSFTLDKTFDCSSLTLADGASGSYTFDNTARIDETDQTDDASVDVTCYRLDVEKTVDETFTRTWDWTIDKSADQTELTLMVDQTFLVNYSVTVDASSTDSDWAASGVITITNPHPTRAADINSVTDVISALGLTDVNATVSDCDGDTTAPYTVPAGGSVDCDYSATLDSGAARENTATATQQLYDFDHLLVASLNGTEDYSDTEDVTFGDPTTVVDECIDVTDTLGGVLGTVCEGVDTLPKTFNYTYLIGPVTVEQCGGFTVDNTATFVANDTGATLDDSWQIIVNVDCPQGCTLTQGYWKTHNETFHGGAPADPNWELIGDFDGDGLFEAEGEDFFDTDQTWFEVFWTPVSGKPYYQLAHQWMAAYLNKLSIEDIGGTIPGDVQAALDAGQLLLEAYDTNKDLKGKDAKTIRAAFVEQASILAEFNEGDGGIPHCDEDSLSVSDENAPLPVVLFPIGLAAPAVAWLRRRFR